MACLSTGTATPSWRDLDTSWVLPCWTYLVLCGLLYRHGQGASNRLCIPAGGDLLTQVLRECHNGPLGGHFGRAKTGSLVCHPAF